MNEAFMNDPQGLIHRIAQHLAEDRKQLAAFEHQADAVTAAYADLMKRIGLEIEAAAGPHNGACHLRG
jgi:hypothetical protein